MNTKEKSEGQRYEKGEIMRNARRLVKYRGEGALAHAQHIAKRMQEEGDEDNAAFWERIAAQVELLIDESPPD